MNELTWNIFYLFNSVVFMCAFVHMHVCVHMCVYVLLLCGLWGLNSGCTSWSAESFPVEPSHWPWLLRWHFMSCSWRVFLPPPLLTLTTFSFLSSWSYRCVPLATLVHYVCFNLTKVSEHRRMPPDSSPEYRWNVSSSWCSLRPDEHRLSCLFLSACWPSAPCKNTLRLL